MSNQINNLHPHAHNGQHLPPILATLFQAKHKKGITFTEIGKKLGKDEILVASIFYGQAKPDPSDLEKLSQILDIPHDQLTDALGADYFPLKGSLYPMPPSDPLLYRYYEILQCFGPAMKAVIHEKFGDGIMSAIDFTLHVDKEEDPKGDRVRVIMSGKFLPYKKW